MKQEMKKISKQQQETYAFFDEQAVDWKEKAMDEKKLPRVNVIKQRNEFALHVFRQRENTNRVLDVGCGIGDLSCEMGKLGATVLGIDFAPGMIKIANEYARKLRAKKVKFSAEDVFEMDHGVEGYDMIAANGFIEYISFTQRDDFLKRCLDLLNPGGSLVVSSRNRLFNLFSANSYTNQELGTGAMHDLMKETIAWGEKSQLEDMLKITPAALTDQNIIHSNTGVDVSTRYQYTPVQLIRMLADMGWLVKEVSPVHVHGVTPAIKDEWPEMHVKIANGLQKEAINNWKMLGQASVFMVHAMKV